MDVKLLNVLNEHKEEYLGYLKDLLKMNTQDIGHSSKLIGNLRVYKY